MDKDIQFIGPFRGHYIYTFKMNFVVLVELIGFMLFFITISKNAPVK